LASCSGAEFICQTDRGGRIRDERQRGAACLCWRVCVVGRHTERVTCPVIPPKSKQFFGSGYPMVSISRPHSPQREILPWRREFPERSCALDGQGTKARVWPISEVAEGTDQHNGECTAFSAAAELTYDQVFRFRPLSRPVRHHHSDVR